MGQLSKTLERNVMPILGATTLAVGVGVGATTGFGPAVLALAGGALVLSIVGGWSSLRVLAGDASVVESERSMGHGEHSRARLEERKTILLRALKDLESEHSLGKIEADDYQTIAEQYRREAKEVMRELDDQLEPVWPRVEELVRSHLEQAGLTPGKEIPAKARDALTEKPNVAELGMCAKCETKNDLDARFCKKCGASMTTEEARDAS